MSDYPERISPTADYIDSRDVRARIDYLSVIRVAGPVEEGLLSDEDADMDQDSLFAELSALGGTRPRGRGQLQ